MRIMKLISVILIIFLLSGCDRQKSHQEVIEDLERIKSSYKQCLSNGFAKKGDIFCKYVLEAPKDMDELLRLGMEEPRKLGSKVLVLQQEIGHLQQSSNAEDQLKLQLKNEQLGRCYLVLKLLSSIK